MDNANITWYVKSDGDYAPSMDHYAGTYTKDQKLTVNLQVWNNRWGTEDVSTLKDAVLNFFFDTLEDSALLSCCRITVGGYDQVPVIVKNGKATSSLGVSLSGVKNDGDADNSVNKNNYVDITFEFDAANYTLKDNDLKSMYFEITTLD